MTAFWVTAAALTAVALAGLLPALLGRGRGVGLTRRTLNVAVHRDRLAELERQVADGEVSPSQADLARAEIERDLLRDVEQGAEAAASGTRGPRWVAGLVALAVPLFAFVVYLEVGSPEAARAGLQPPPPSASQGGAPHGGAPLENLVVSLAERLKANPSDAQGWVMLGRSYASLERHAEAREAFEAALRLAPESPEVLTHLAESTGLAAGGNLTGRPEELLRRALELQPGYADALWLSGLAASQRQQYAVAIGFWERLVAILQDPQEKEFVSRFIADARKQTGETVAATPADPAMPPVTAATTATPGPVAATPAPTPVTATPPPATAPAIASTGAVKVRVTLARELQDRANASDIVFIFARPAEGSRMPITIVRRTVADLPASLTLDDSMAMNPSIKLSSFPKVVVAARVSKSGSAMPQAGDLEGASAPIAPAEDAAQVDVRIDRQL